MKNHVLSTKIAAKTSEINFRVIYSCPECSRIDTEVDRSLHAFILVDSGKVAIQNPTNGWGYCRGPKSKKSSEHSREGVATSKFVPNHNYTNHLWK